MPTKVVRGHEFKSMVYLISGGFLLLVSVIPVVLAIQTSARRNLTSLETTLFTVITFILSTVGSGLISAYYSDIQSRREYARLARPALRRILSINRSAAMIRQVIEGRQKLINDGDQPSLRQVGDWIAGFDQLMAQHVGQLDAAIADWQELLPGDYAQIVDLASMGATIEDKLEEIRLLNHEQTEEARRDVVRLRSDVARLRQELRDQQRTTGMGLLAPYSTRPIGSPESGGSVFEGRDFAVLDDVIQSGGAAGSDPITPP
jgi:hypothetical protein